MTRPPMPLDAVTSALASLAVPAPPSLRPATLVAVGLADAYDTLATPIGRVHVAWNAFGVSAVDRAADDASFERRVAATTGRPARRARMPDGLRRSIERRLAGDRRARVALDLRGRTPFERSVLLKALEIPSGEVRPYGWIAAEIGRPRAVRAVGSALAHNPVPLIVPCHRVVRSDGLIGQYSLGGPAVKRRVLAAEGADPDALEGLARAGIRYIGSDTTRIFCHPSCRQARRIGERHRVSFPSAEASRTAGYRPCRICRPALGSDAA